MIKALSAVTNFPACWPKDIFDSIFIMLTKHANIQYIWRHGCFFYSLLSLLVFGWTTNVKYVQHMKTVRWLFLVGKNDFIGKIYYYVRVNLLDVRKLKFAYFTWWWFRQIMYCLVHFFPFILLNDLWVVSISYIFNLKRSHEKENEIRRIYMYAINSNREHFLFSISMHNPALTAMPCTELYTQCMR